MLKVRFPVLLSNEEKDIARVVSQAFKQSVCGFDLLRSKGKSFVCDVNGWSFVKGSHKYYDDAACLLRSMALSHLAPHRLLRLPPALTRTLSARALEAEELANAYYPDKLASTSLALSAITLEPMSRDLELRCVLLVARQ